MGWCSGSSVYLAVADTFGHFFEEPSRREDGIQAFKMIAEELQKQDWDCEGDALDGLSKGTVAFEGLALAMGINTSCEGKCLDINCDGEGYCGCLCHY
jgi:hypothetical protein